ncbi:MAG: hypothetical protein KME49_25250 [Brasilonema octagenarum HA4186-MV1]|nr:hypothetical protein [Brasilonema octagenarum HA4186-MV1]
MVFSEVALFYKHLGSIPGYYLANRGTDTRTIQSYLGHNNIQHPVRYTELASGRFQGLWDG